MGNPEYLDRQEFKNEIRNLSKAVKALSKFGGFYGWAYFLFLLIGTVSLGGVFAYSLQKEILLLDRDFRQSGKSITLSLAEASGRAMVTEKYSPLILMFEEIMEELEQDDSVPLIDEMFLLSRKGEILAHHDPTLVTVHAKSTISKISGHYNNEFFHNSILLAPGDVYVQPYPSDKFDRGGRLLELLKAILPEYYFRAVDFSMPIHINKKSEASVHVVMSRRNMDEFLFAKVESFGYAWAAMAGISTILLLLMRIPVQKKGKQVQGLITLIKTESESVRFKEEMSYIEQKIEELKAAASIHDATASRKPGRNDILEPIDPDNVKDAILIEEN